MATPLGYITRWVPAFAQDPDINEYIQEAEDETGTSYCDDETRNKVVAAKVCHELSLDNRVQDGGGDGSIVGPIISEKEGEVSRSYGKVTKGDSNNAEEYYGQTRWGLKVLKYQDKCFVYPRNRFV